jgi:DNA primase
MSSDPNAPRRRTLYDINDRARDLYVRILKSKHGRSFRQYLVKRGFKGKTIIEYKVGASLPTWSFISQKLIGEGFSEDELINAGLSIRGKNGPLYDRFRGRLMIPIIDTLDRTLGFGARAMGDDSPKYINSPESPVFQKSKILFGLDLAKNACRDSGQLVIMEGYTDVMHAHEAGVANCCAVMGTALTRDHVPILARFAEEVVLAFDGDEAGRRAMLKSILELGDVQFALKVLPLPEGKDPADVVTSEGAEAFRARVAAAEPASDWMFRVVASTVKDQDMRSKLKAFRDIAPYILSHRSPALRDQLLEKAALEFSTYVSGLHSVLREVASGGRRPAEALEAAIEGAGNVERMFFLSLLANAEYLPQARRLLEPDDFDDPAHRRLARVIFEDGFSLGDPDSLMRMREIYEDDTLRPLVVRLTQTLLDEEDPAAGRYTIDALKRSLLFLLRRQYDNECKRLQTCMADLSRPTAPVNNDALMLLMRERDELDRNYQEICNRLE